MSPEKQRIAIAKACPSIAEIDKDNGGVFWKHPDPFVMFDPLNDLNAMHEAVNLLTLSDKIEWIAWINSLTNNPDDKNDQAWFPLRFIKAKPSVWAEAFLKTIGKWEEE